MSGLNILLEEIAAPKELWSRAPRYVSIALTNACELRCPYCYAPKRPGRLDGNAVLAWIHELDGAGTLGVGFGGGEPTAHPEFARICVEAARQTRVAVTFTTHAHRLDPKLAATLRGSVHFVRVSMDGLGATYERLRGRSFAKFQRQIDLVKSISPFGINLVVNDETVDELNEIAQFAASVGAAELLLLPEQRVRDRPPVGDATVARLSEWLMTSPPPLRLSISEAGSLDTMPLADPFAGERPLDSHAHVDAHGVLKIHAYASDGVPVTTSILESLAQLEARGRTG